ncbi:hypothetical protein NDU88_001408 [Pleurodeles waltl]|uniref:Uncharacterized protein n=1 Tax=Pleurodeles waltl TaxID=8319 RepID=A0AAV7NAR9_PLEWA|nr:hypothetical protein NDU88_001408 [Pleurodeles waltl]
MILSVSAGMEWEQGRRRETLRLSSEDIVLFLFLTQCTRVEPDRRVGPTGECPGGTLESHRRKSTHANLEIEGFEAAREKEDAKKGDAEKEDARKEEAEKEDARKGDAEKGDAESEEDTEKGKENTGIERESVRGSGEAE